MSIFSRIATLFSPRTPAGVNPLRPEHRKRREQMALYWKYFRGNHRRPLKPTATGVDDSVIVNLARKVVTESVDMLFGQAVTFHTDQSAEERTPEEQYLDRCWADDPLTEFSKGDFLQGLGQNGAVAGHAFVRVYPAAEEGGRPRMVNLDPALVDVITDPDNKKRVLELHIVWQTAEGWKRDRIYRANEKDDSAGWWIARELWMPGGKWELAAAEGGGPPNPEPWRWPFPPLFWCQNLKNTQSFWGISDEEDIDINDAINFNASNINRILRFHAHPRTVAIGIQAKQIAETAVDGIWALPGSADQVRLQNLEMQSDLGSSRAFLGDLRTALHEVTGTPNLDPAQVQVGALSGFALRIMYGPLLAKTNGKRLRYGGLLDRLNYALLVMGGFKPDPERPPTTAWSNPLPENDLEKAQIFNLLAAASGNVRAAAVGARYDDKLADELASVGPLPPLPAGVPR